MTFYTDSQNFQFVDYSQGNIGYVDNSSYISDPVADLSFVPGGLGMSRDSSSSSSTTSRSPHPPLGSYFEQPVPASPHPLYHTPPSSPDSNTGVGFPSNIGSSTMPREGESPESSSSKKKKREPKYYCFEPKCNYMTDRLHDLQRHDTAKHIAPEKVKMLDCPYGGCGHVGSHGFKRKDHLRDHSKRYHRRDLPKSMGGTGQKVDSP